jgi:DNA adenine methylase
VPLHNELLTFWKNNKETDDLRKALRFLFLSNMTLLGTGTSLRYTTQEDRQQILDGIDLTFKKIKNTTFNNVDFRKFLNDISFRHGKQDINRAFIYADPPYIETTNNYKNGFTKQDTIDLFDKLIEMKCKFAISEFDNEFIINEANKRCLNINYIGERRNLKNKRTEILITNYENAPTLF